MVLFFLYIKAELENVSSIRLRDDAPLRMDVRNPLNDFEVREKVVVDPTELDDDNNEDSKLPPYHFGLKWERSQKFSTLTIKTEAEVKTLLKKKKKVEPPREYTADDSGDWVPVLAVDCRGLEPNAFYPMGGSDSSEFVVTSAGGKEFTEDVDLGEGDWAEYDEENDEPVSMSEIEFKWEAV